MEVIMKTFESPVKWETIAPVILSALIQSKPDKFIPNDKIDFEQIKRTYREILEGLSYKTTNLDTEGIVEIGED
jgi:hypothetical protein